MSMLNIPILDMHETAAAGLAECPSCGNRLQVPSDSRFRAVCYCGARVTYKPKGAAAIRYHGEFRAT